MAYLLERVETRQDGTTNPGRILAFRRGIDLDLHVLQCKLLDLVQQTVTEPCNHVSIAGRADQGWALTSAKGATAAEHNVGEETLPQVEVHPVY